MTRTKRLHPVLKAFVVVSAVLVFGAFTFVVLLPNLVTLYQEFIIH